MKEMRVLAIGMEVGVMGVMTMTQGFYLDGKEWLEVGIEGVLVGMGGVLVGVLGNRVWREMKRIGWGEKAGKTVVL